MTSKRAIEFDDVESLVEDISTVSYLLGIITGYKELSEWYRVEAGKQYVNRNDTLASTYRGVSDSINLMVMKLQGEYNTKSKPVKDDKWKELEELITGKSGKES